MKSIALATLLAITGAAFAEEGARNAPIYSDGNGVRVTAAPFDAPQPFFPPILEYDSFNNAPGPAGLLAISPATGPIGFDDYTTQSVLDGAAAASDLLTLDRFFFVGGVSNPGEVLFMDFFDPNGAFVDGFGVQLANGGNFRYTITIGTPVSIPAAGIVQLFANDDPNIAPVSTGQFFVSDNAVVIGANDPLFGPAPGPLGEILNHVFAIEVATCTCGDVNDDGSVNASDIDCFVSAVIGTDACDVCSDQSADTNNDGSVNASDIDTFVDAVISGGCLSR